MERGGTRLQDVLGRKNPWKESSCGRTECLMCNSKHKKKGATKSCDQENICYVICCDTCKLSNVEAKYYGESSRTGYLHGCEHARGQASRSEDNPLAKHDLIHHQGHKGEYSMAILRHHMRALPRQIQEATEIKMSEAKIILNSRGEWNGIQIPRVTVHMGARVQLEEYQGSGGQDIPGGLSRLPGGPPTHHGWTQQRYDCQRPVQ